MQHKNKAGADQDISVIAPGARVVGDVHTTGVVQIGGNVVGNVRADRQVLVAKGGVVDGHIETPEAIIGGEVRGLVQATQRVAVQASAFVYGTITTPRLAVEEGATLDVDLSMADRGGESGAADTPLVAHLVRATNGATTRRMVSAGTSPVAP